MGVLEVLGVQVEHEVRKDLVVQVVYEVQGVQRVLEVLGVQKVQGAQEVLVVLEVQEAFAEISLLTAKGCKNRLPDLKTNLNQTL